MTLLVSCIDHSAKYRKLKSENEALIAEKASASTLLDETLSTLNDIQTDIQAMQEAENILVVTPIGEDISADKKAQLKKNVRKIAETLQSNREQLAALQAQVKKSNFRSDALQRTIDRISSDLDQKAIMIATLQEELAKKDIRVQELDEVVTAQSDDIKTLSETAVRQSEKLSEQNKKLNTAYYCLGTEKELKKENILTGGGLFSKSKALEGFFNKEYFVAIDIRKTTEIELFAHKAEIRSNHPKDTYKFTKDENENLILHITDAEQFWNLNRYLVIEVK
jgi:chromosome segregation ATPase